ncbi:HCP-like protein [Exidia glandulosa HHB12029]|uniref:HCP-like protein n=1 Tax=Exidia glandulosa HHB12029 TaxID=1314781 RepID=A0A165ZBE3_EXIGL|nr:HCP-like protein [Exidia glandulosa HHB12029]
MRKAWLVALLVPGVLAQATQDSSTTDDDASDKAANTYDRAAEASQAYDKALKTLSTIGSVQAPHEDGQAALFSNYQGPIASALRIALRLVYQPWLSRSVAYITGKEATLTRRYEDARSKAVKVVDLLTYAAELGNQEALYKLAQISMFPPSILPRDSRRAFELFSRHAELTGNATSQAMTAFFYATGFGNATEADQAKALLYYTFAAHQGDYGSEMSLGFRYWSGIGVKEDCMAAMEWYEAAAEKSMATFLTGPPGGRTLPLLPTRLSDFDGGAYGIGSSVASTGMNINRNVIRAYRARAAGEKWSDVVEYYQFNADRGDIEFALRLGRIFYQGSLYTVGGGISGGAEAVGAVPRDFHRAKAYFMKIARLVWSRENVASPLTHRKEGATDGQKLAASIASAYLGRMYLRGEGFKQDARMAKMWFERGMENANAECANGLGIIYRDGLLDGKPDMKKALTQFGVAAGQEHAEALVNLGKHYYQHGDLPHAMMYFENAIKHGSPFEAYYYIAQIHASNAYKNSLMGSCSFAVSFYKHVVERGSWRENLLGEAEAIWFKEGASLAEKQGAMLRWYMAAERGYESAQNNIAYVLDQDRDSLRGTSLARPVSNDTARDALKFWMRSSAQRNIDALIKVGDYYYHGLGVADEPEALRWEKAAGYYHSAVDTHISALAMWNLGWMYENGRGVTQDFHLAKRYYDMALETNAEAYFPVLLSLIKLHVRALWHSLSGGKQRALSIWGDDGEGGDDAWYFGRAKEELKRRLRGKARVDGGGGKQEDGAGNGAQQDGGEGEQGLDADREPTPDEDPIQWARDRRAAAQDATAANDDYGPEDYWDGDEEDEFADTLILLLLCATVTALIWARGRWAERRRQEEQGPNAQPPFQPPGIVL